MTSTASRLRIGVAGLGSIGRRHARLLADRDDVVVHTFDAASPSAGEAVFGPAEPDFDTLLRHAGDGVVIATPDHLHAPMTVAACRAGVPVLVEKPVADDLAAADVMERAADGSRTPVLVGHVLRYTPALIHARTVLDDGVIGHPVSFHTTLGAYETLEFARSRFTVNDRYRLVFDYSHEWDYLQWLLGPVQRVIATSTTTTGVELVQRPNAIDALLEVGPSTIGSVHLDYVERHGARTTRIVGDRGVLTVDLRAEVVTLAVDGETTERFEFTQERDDLFRSQIDHFVAVVRGEATPRVSIADGRAAIAVAAAVVSSITEDTWQSVDQRPPA